VDKFGALSDPTRRSIVEMLARKGALSARDISSQFKMSPPAVSQHLKVLREARLVQMEKRAQQRIYRINPEAVHELEDWARQLVEMFNQRFDALDALLEVEKRKANPINDRKDE
jgi:DNA-binding transcriptional ArsR family regulator